MDHLPKTHKQPIIANNIKQNNILLTFHQGQKQLVKNLATVIINHLIFTCVKALKGMRTNQKHWLTPNKWLTLTKIYHQIYDGRGIVADSLS